jgi:hypothetical protein
VYGSLLATVAVILPSLLAGSAMVYAFAVPESTTSDSRYPTTAGSNEENPDTTGTPPPPAAPVTLGPVAPAPAIPALSINATEQTPNPAADNSLRLNKRTDIAPPGRGPIANGPRLPSRGRCATAAQQDPSADSRTASRDSRARGGDWHAKHRAEQRAAYQRRSGHYA